MFLRLLVLFTLVPAVEIYILIRVGSVIGPLNTLLIILLTGVLGAIYARRQGLTILFRIQQSMARGRMPGAELIDGAMLVAGGALLLTPGFLTDLTGFALIFPPTRDGLKVAARRYIERMVREGRVTVHRRGRRRPPEAGRPPGEPGRDDRGETRRDDREENGRDALEDRSPTVLPPKRERTPE